MIPRIHCVHMLGKAISVQPRVENHCCVQDSRQCQGCCKTSWSSADDYDIENLFRAFHGSNFSCGSADLVCYTLLGRQMSLVGGPCLGSGWLLANKIRKWIARQYQRQSLFADLV